MTRHFVFTLCKLLFQLKFAFSTLSNRNAVQSHTKRDRWSPWSTVSQVGQISDLNEYDDEYVICLISDSLF